LGDVYVEEVDGADEIRGGLCRVGGEEGEAGAPAEELGEEAVALRVERERC
jgi:hypothetical protein